MSNIERPMSAQPMPEDARCVFKGVLFDVYQWEQELYDGSKKIFEKLKRRDTATVIPVLANGKLLVEEDEQPLRGMKFTFPAGQIEDGEDPEKGALRELLEETGYTPKKLTLLTAIQPVTKVDWAIFTFIAHGCEKVAEQQLDAGERIALREVTFDEALALADDPRFLNPELVVTFLRARYDAEERRKLETELFG